ncbi:MULTISPECIES: bacteriocin [Chryseobacterium]|uniref:bacteriocin n=1 Tax=Chryseobacterium TaxID=59732 RepID=UPI001BE66BFF|nr:MULTISPECIES: bacteriocin [Chryseobacterium]MBT2622212.1 bacteriocin [Chryseobacterium sp. ISL-6]
MKNQNLQKGKKLTKKELKTIVGGMLDCKQPIACPTYPCDPPLPDYPNGCTTIAVGCAQKECRPGIDPV